MTAPASSLLSRLQRLIESSYDWTTGINDLGSFVVGDEGYRRIYGTKEILEELPGSGPGARTLVTSESQQVRARVYYPDRLVEELEQRNPLHRVDDENVAPFSVLVEELDHLLMLAWCWRHGRPVRLLEMEYHANVTKYLVLTHFLGRLSRRTRLAPAQRQWVLDRLFAGIGEDLPLPLRDRYRTAGRLALRFIGILDPLPAPDRVRVLRRFGRRSWGAQRASLESPERRRLVLLLGP